MYIPTPASKYIYDKRDKNMIDDTSRDALDCVDSPFIP
jgi:hypothetical protein